MVAYDDIDTRDYRPTSVTSWKATHRRVSEIAAGNVYAAIDFLLTENSKRGDYRCTGNLTHTAAGVPTFTYCGRVQCWKCSPHRRHLDREKMLHHATTAAAAGEPLYFLTIYHENADRDTTDESAARAWSDVTKTLFDSLRRKAARDGVTLNYAHVTGFKKTTDQIHTHAITNYLPDATPAPTDQHPRRVKCDFLDTRADGFGVVVWSEMVESAAAVCSYLAKHLAPPPYNVTLPRHFRRVVYSRQWQASPETDQKTGVTPLFVTAAALGASVTRADGFDLTPHRPAEPTPVESPAGEPISVTTPPKVYIVDSTPAPVGNSVNTENHTTPTSVTATPLDTEPTPKTAGNIENRHIRVLSPAPNKNAGNRRWWWSGGRVLSGVAVWLIAWFFVVSLVSGVTGEPPKMPTISTPVGVLPHTVHHHRPQLVTGESAAGVGLRSVLVVGDDQHTTPAIERKKPTVITSAVGNRKLFKRVTFKRTEPP